MIECSEKPVSFIKKRSAFLFSEGMGKKILDIEDVARLKGVHPGTVYHWAEKGILKSIKVGHNLFFSQGDIKGWQPPKRGRRPKEGGR